MKPASQNTRYKHVCLYHVWASIRTDQGPALKLNQRDPCLVRAHQKVPELTLPAPEVWHHGLAFILTMPWKMHGKGVLGRLWWKRGDHCGIIEWKVIPSTAGRKRSLSLQKQSFLPSSEEICLPLPHCSFSPAPLHFFLPPPTCGFRKIKRLWG